MTLQCFMVESFKSGSDLLGLPELGAPVRKIYFVITARKKRCREIPLRYMRYMILLIADHTG